MRSTLPLLAFAATLSASPTNLVLNGSFENNTAGSSQFNLTTSQFNALMPNVVASITGLPSYPGQGQTDIQINNSQYFPLSTAGSTFVSLINQHDRVGLALASTLVAGSTYTLSFNYAVNTQLVEGNGPINVYAANTGTSFDTLIHTISAGIAGYQWYTESFSFIADASTNYIGFTGDMNQVNLTWFAIDAVSLTLGGGVIPEPSTYGLILGSLALAGAAIRRRRAK